MNKANKVLLALLLCAGTQAFGYYFWYANNVDPKGRKLPSKIAVAVYKDEERFKQFLKDQHVATKTQGYIIKYGPIFGKIAGKAGGKIVQAGVTAESGKGAGAAAGKATEVGLELVGKATALIAKALGGPVRDLQQKIEANDFRDPLYMGVNDTKQGGNNPWCQRVEKMDEMMQKNSNKKWHLNEDNPRPLYVVIFNRDKTVGDDYQILFNKYIYPMGNDPYKGDFFKGKGKARGGPFASWMIQTAYQETPLWVDGIPVKDANGNVVIDSDTGEVVTTKVPDIDPATGKQKIDVRVVADLTMIHDRGGVECSQPGGINPDNAPDQGGGVLATDTIKETAQGS